MQYLTLIPLYLAKNPTTLEEGQGRYQGDELISALVDKAEVESRWTPNFGFGQRVYDGDPYYYREYIRKKSFAKKMSSALG